MSEHREIYAIVHVTRGIVGISARSFLDAAEEWANVSNDDTVFKALIDGRELPPGFRRVVVADVNEMELYKRGTA